MGKCEKLVTQGMLLWRFAVKRGSKALSVFAVWECLGPDPFHTHAGFTPRQFYWLGWSYFRFVFVGKDLATVFCLMPDDIHPYTKQNEEPAELFLKLSVWSSWAFPAGCSAREWRFYDGIKNKQTKRSSVQGSPLLPVGQQQWQCCIFQVCSYSLLAALVPHVEWKVVTRKKLVFSSQMCRGQLCWGASTEWKTLNISREHNWVMARGLLKDPRNCGCQLFMLPDGAEEWNLLLFPQQRLNNGQHQMALPATGEWVSGPQQSFLPNCRGAGLDL